MYRHMYLCVYVTGMYQKNIGAPRVGIIEGCGVPKVSGRH